MRELKRSIEVVNGVAITLDELLKLLYDVSIKTSEEFDFCFDKDTSTKVLIKGKKALLSDVSFEFEDNSDRLLYDRLEVA